MFETLKTLGAGVGIGDVKDPFKNTDLMKTVSTILTAVIGIVGILAVIMIVYGGIQYTMSAGDAGKVKKAKDTILYGVIGLIVALLAFAIVNFVLGSNVLNA